MFINIGIWKHSKHLTTFFFGSGTKLFITFLSLRFFDMRRERHNFFNKRAAHFVDPNWSRLGETKNRLPSSRLESQLTVFFSNSKIVSASGHDVIHVPGLISYLGFLLWHLWLSHPPRAREHLRSVCAPN